MPRRAYLARESLVRLAVFRIALGAVLLEVVGHTYAHRNLFGGLASWPTFYGLVMFIWSVAIVSLVVGFQTRTAAALNYVFAVLLLGRWRPHSQTADAVAIGLSLLALVVPCGGALSLDRRIARSKRRPLGFAASRWALAGFLSLVYVESALHKVSSPMWRQGLGAVAPMGLPSLTWTDTRWLEVVPDAPLMGLGWGVIAFELLFPGLYMWHRTRTLAIVAGIGMHLAIALVYPIPVFAALMIVPYTGLLPDSWYRPLERLEESWCAGRVNLRRLYKRGLLKSLRARASLTVAGATLALLLVAGLHSRIVERQRWLRGALYALTGITCRAVFSDDQFLPYAYQLRLVRVGPGPGPVAMPYGGDGLLTWSVRDGVWEHWWKRTQGPWVERGEAEGWLARWARFYWPPALGPRLIRVEGRPQRVELGKVDTGLFRENQAVRWRQLGTIRLARGTPAVVDWARPPEPGEWALGDYLRRALSANPR